MGIKLAWNKGTRGDEITWIGVHFRLDWEKRAVVCSIPELMVSMIMEDVDFCLEWAVVPAKRLRTFAGRLSWVATVVPRTRWAVSVLFAVLADHEREMAKPIAKRAGPPSRD